MNILIPHNWLLEHLETDADPETVQRLVSLSGPSVERIEEKAGESVYDIEVTTNRVDAMSIRGIAREAAVILQQAGVTAQLKQTSMPIVPNPETTELQLPQIHNNPDLCRRILCVVLDQVNHTTTPDWMAKRLEQIDQNVHDAVIDITNYVTHELGHPCHAFDYDKIMSLGGEIHVKEAAAGQPFTTLDGESYETVGGEVVFTNQTGEIIDLPAIKGTANTAVDDNTTRILLWIESIKHEKVRFGSMTHAIRTVAAQLNEKHVDPHLADSVLQRGVELYRQLCNAQVASPMYDDFPTPVTPQTVTLKTQRIFDYLGISLDRDAITHILESLDCAVTWSDDETLAVTPPTFRPDITIAADVIEELARIYGYHNIPSTLMDTRLPLNKPDLVNFTAEHQMKEWLSLLGWQEVYTYSMISAAQAEKSGWPLVAHLKLQNPLTDDKVYLRRSLIPSLNEILNTNSQNEQLSVFEIAQVYHPQENELPSQELHLTLLGRKPIRQMIGDLEVLLKRFYLSLRITQESAEQGKISIFSDQSERVEVGTISRLDNRTTAINLEMAKVLPQLKTHPTYQPLPNQPPLTEALTFTLPPQTQLGPVIETISNLDPLINSVALQDSYQQNFTFSISYLDREKPLASSDIEQLRKQIVTEIGSQYDGILVGSLA